VSTVKVFVDSSREAKNGLSDDEATKITKALAAWHGPLTAGQCARRGLFIPLARRRGKT